MYGSVIQVTVHFFKHSMYFLTVAKYSFLRTGSTMDTQLTWFLAYVEKYTSHPKAHVSQTDREKGKQLLSTYPCPALGGSWTLTDPFAHSANLSQPPAMCNELCKRRCTKIKNKMKRKTKWHLDLIHLTSDLAWKFASCLRLIKFITRNLLGRLNIILIVSHKGCEAYTTTML